MGRGGLGGATWLGGWTMLASGIWSGCRSGREPPVLLDEPVLTSGLETAPGVTLLAERSADLVTVQGAVQHGFAMDLDDVQDERYNFKVSLIDRTGRVLWQRTDPTPQLVQDFLDHYSAASGYDLIGLMPFLGRFPVQVPVLDDTDQILFEERDSEGEWRLVGGYPWDSLVDLGVLPDIVGTATVAGDSEPSALAGRRLDLVILGDGYTDDELGTFALEADMAAAAILDTEPFRSLSDAIRIHRVDAPSEASGISYDCDPDCGLRDTVYDTVFALEFVEQFTGQSFDGPVAFQLDQFTVSRAASAVPWDVGMVLLNTERMAGMTVYFATLSTWDPPEPPLADLDPWVDTAVHELGHAVGFLGDEYMAYECIEPTTRGAPLNVSFGLESLPWERWIEEGTGLPTPDDAEHAQVVGAFEGAYNCPDAYRPASDCLMRTGGAYCPVCTELLLERMLDFVDPLDGATAARVDDHTLRVDLDLLLPDTRAEIWLDDSVVAELDGDGSFDVELSDLDAGSHHLRVQAHWDTAWVREEDPRLDQQVEWTFELSERD